MWKKIFFKEVGHEKSQQFKHQPFTAVQSRDLSPPRRTGVGSVSQHPDNPLAGAGVWPLGAGAVRAAGPGGAPWPLHLNSQRASSSPRRSTPSQTVSVPRHASQSQRFRKHLHFSVLGGGNAIYSLIFHTLRRVVNDPTEGDITLAAGVQACCHL